MRHNRITAALLIPLILICGCQKDTVPENPADQKEIPAYTTLYPPKEGQPDLYLVVKNLDSSYWKVVIKGTCDGGAQMGCNVYYSGTYSETDWQSQERLLNEAVEAGADGIIFSPDDSVMLSAKISEIYRADIPIVLVDTIVNTEDFDICYMTDNLVAGQQAAKEMLRLLHQRGIQENEHAEIAIQIGAANSQTINERLAGFCQYWTKHAPAKWLIADKLDCNEGNVDYGLTLARSTLKSNPHIVGVFGTNNGSTVGFARALTEDSRTDIAIVGFDYSEEIAQMIDDPAYAASTMLQRQYQMGVYGVEACLRLRSGEQINRKFFDTGVITVNDQTLNDPDVQQILHSYEETA